MTSSNVESDHLFRLLSSNEVKKIETTVFVTTDPTQTKLPPHLNSNAIELLNKINGCIYPIALRGKCQAGKSTTLNRIAKLSNVSIERLLEVAESFGGSTTEGIWLMIITFKNEDTLLLFDVQGTDRGADELTHQLIAFMDHICAKVVDIFRMPVEGFSNEYINALYCLAMARESVANLSPASHKAILWTNCALPKRSPLKQRTTCNTPAEYQMELLTCSVGERALLGQKAKQYAEHTTIITTSKPPDEILFEISELNNDHPFIQNSILPALKQILANVQPLKIASHVIRDGRSFVNYLQNVYSNVKASTINLPFCQQPVIRSIALSLSKEIKNSAEKKIRQEVEQSTTDMNKVCNTLVPRLQQMKQQSVQEFESKLSDLPREHWEDQLQVINDFLNREIQTVIERFRPLVLEHSFHQNYRNLSQLCTLGSPLNKLTSDLEMKVQQICMDIQRIPFFQNNINVIERENLKMKLDNHKNELCNSQKQVEADWERRLADFRKNIYSSESEGVDTVIDQMIYEQTEYGKREFSRFNITWQPFFNVQTMKQSLKEDNAVRSQQVALKLKSKCISQFETRAGEILFNTQMTVPKKYGQLRIELEMILRKYYDDLPWPLNDQTIQGVDDALQRVFDRSMQNLFTPEIKEQLKKDRMAQMNALSKLRLAENESYLWVYCVGCNRIFAGRTRGCINVTCSHYTTKTGSKNVDHGCGLQFEWAKAQPVPINALPSELWFSQVETDQRRSYIQNLIFDIKHGVRQISSAKSTRVRRGSTGG